MAIDKEDYAEQACLLCMNKSDAPAFTVPIERVFARLDDFFAKNDYSGAARLLEYWASEAQSGGDKRGELSIRNEMMGLYRKVSNKEKSMENVSLCLEILKITGLTEYLTGGTTFLNIGTVYKTFGEDKLALDYYNKAEIIYLNQLKPDDSRFGGLYNNKGLALSALGEYDNAFEYFKKALSVMEKQENGQLDMAITYLNIADNETEKLGFEDAAENAEKYVLKAWELISLEEIPKDGYYAFVCEKCASGFGYHGFFMYQNELEKRAKEIYERS